MVKEALLAALKRFAVFSIGDIANVLGKGRGYASLVAYRLKRSGAIHEIEKGKYTLEEDPFIVASCIVWPSYISGWAALHFYKLTEQLPFTIHVVTTRKRKRRIVLYGDAKIEYIRIRKRAFFGFQRLQYMGKEIFIAEKEKALIDALISKKMSLAEAAELIKNNKRKISRRKLLSYARVSKGLPERLKGALHD